MAAAVGPRTLWASTVLNWLNGTELPLYFTITVANFRPPESGQFDRGPWAAPSHRAVTGVISVIIGTFHRTPDATPVKIQEILHYVCGPQYSGMMNLDLVQIHTGTMTGTHAGTAR